MERRGQESKGKVLMATLEIFDCSGNRPVINIEALKKGDYISPEIIEKVYGIKRIDIKYSMATFKIQQEIMHQSQDKMLAKVENHGVRVLTDQEANEYAMGMKEKCISRHETWQDRHKKGVDPKNLNSEEARKRDANIAAHARIIQHAAGELRNLISGPEEESESA